MANTFELIASSTVGSGGAASINFTSIPSTYTDIVFKLSLRDTYSGVASADLISFNGSTASITSRMIQGSGSAVSSTSSPARFAGNNVSATATASTFSSVEVYIPNYAGSANKSFSVDSVTENNATEAYANFIAGLWSNSAAINQVTFTPTSGSFVQYSTAYLYGVKNA
jgi:hypothetical protein